MDKHETERIDRITAVIHYLLKGKIPDKIACEADPHDEIRQLSEKVNELRTDFKEIQSFIVPLAEGMLDIELPRQNILASPFKQLHASLSHLTWQTQQIAQGDFNQKVDFMGDFSQAFNSMVESLKEARSQLISEGERFKQLAELKDHYLNVMAHDIRTPIGAVIGFADILLDGNLDEPERKHVRIIKRNCDSLLALINNILDMAKLEKHKMELEEVPFSPHTLAEDVRMMVQPKISPQVRFISDVDKNVPSRVMGDPHRLKQILLNLVSNAIKFTQKGHVWLTIKPQQQDAEQFQLHFSVKDTGIGIAEANLSNIFTPFVQADNSISSRFGGTGLGLAIAHELVTLMGGELKVSSEIGKGTTFFFSLSFKAAKISDTSAIQDEKQRFRRSNILVVDDDPHALEIIAHTLEKHHVRFTLCQESTSAYDMLIAAHEAKTPFTLAWLDIDMPELNGFELAAKIREDKRLNRLRLVACTAHTEKIGDSDSPSYFSFVATKPVSPRALQRILEESTTAYPDAEMQCDLSGVRLLVVDDNPLNRFIVRSTLQKLNMEITEAENGAEAVRKVSENEFDVILMDKMMPVMDGTEAIQRIRETYDKHELPILAFTAGDPSKDKDVLIKAGANSIISKPINYNKIVESLCEAMMQKI